MNRLHVYKSNYNYNQQRVYSLFLADRITQEVVIPFEEFTLLDLSSKNLWIFGYVKDLVNYQNKAEFSGTGYVYLSITKSPQKNSQEDSLQEKQFEKIILKLIEKKILVLEQIYQYPLIVPSQDSFLKLFLEEETYWRESIGVLLATLFQSKEIESINKEQSKYLCYDFETLKESKPKKSRERPKIDREEYVLGQIHKLLEGIDKQEIVKDTLLEQLYTIVSMQDDVTARRVKEAIYVYASLLGGSIL